MGTKRSSKKTRRPSETVQPQSISQQPEAGTEQLTADALLQESDLTTNTTEEPPPAYGKNYGEIRNEKNGLSTSARVTEDGRVDININQLDRRLSQVFGSNLYQQLQGVQDSSSSPPPYIPASLEREGADIPPPSLNIVIQVVGSRGDVQPFVALGKVLKEKHGHRVRLATHPTFKQFVQENGLEFFSIGGDPAQLMAFMVKNPGLMPGFRSVMAGDVKQRRKDVAGYIQGCWRSCYADGDGMMFRVADHDISVPSERDPELGSKTKPFVADCIIANPPSFAHIHCAEKLGIPLHIMFTMPYSPTQAFPHPLANIQSSNADPQLTNYMSYAMIEVLTWQGLGDIINRFRTKCLGLDPVSLIWAPGMLQRLKVPHTYCWSPALIPKPRDWESHISISGFYFLNLATNYTPPSDLQAFLDNGPPPVYIGFGSIVLDDPDAMTQLIFDAARKTGQRFLVSKGWGGMGAQELQVPNGVFILGNVPHDWLFKQVACVVHHGGAGTTAAGIASGRPTLVVPFFGDQPFWGAMCARAGAGPDPIPHKQLTADKLADAINFCLRPESLERANDLARKIATEQGSDMGVQLFHEHLAADRLRCILVPSRPAVWRIKHSEVRLSAFAAWTLVDAKLIDFNDLKRFRPQEYDTDQGPPDPLSGGSTALFGVFSTMVMGLADFPSETWKAMKIPTNSSRQRSHASAVSEQSVQSSSKHSDKGQSQAQRQNEAEPDQEHDMMRQAGVHTSKGLGRMVKSLFTAPGDISVSMTKGFHNAPKLWGDDTVRPQEQVKDFKSGAKAAGKEFGFGMYDGVTGLVTQPWKGAQKEGVGGFFKGFGKGIGGFAAKPSAALMSVPAYMLRGVHKEVENLFSGNVQEHIMASRISQGHAEWTQSSEIEKQDVIDGWNLIQRYVKEKHTSDEMMRDFLKAKRRTNLESTPGVEA